MYCPNCKTYFDEGNFCLKCGTKLVENPSTGLNIGDANAFNGSITYDASHHVLTTNNITQVAAQKTEVELLQEKNAKYLEACRKAYEDNVLDHSEVLQLDRYRVELGLSIDEADNMLKLAAQQAQQSSQRQELTSIARIKLKQFTEALNANDTDTLLRQLDGMGTLVDRFANEELQFTYYLVLSTLKPTECIKKYASTRADNYWQMYCTSLSYRRSGAKSKSDDILWSLDDKFPNYPADNLALLAVACAFLGGEIQEAKAYLQELAGDHSSLLNGLAECVYLILEPDTATAMGATEQRCLFYLTKIFEQETTEEKARRKAEEEARRKAEEEAAKRKAEEEIRRKAEQEIRRKAEEEAKRKAEEEAKRKAEEEAKRKAEEEAKRKAEEEAKRKAEEEAKRKAEAEAKARTRYEVINGIGYFPYGVTCIKKEAFKECRNLVKINIPMSVTEIGDSAFSCCSSLKSVIILDGVKKIGNSAFFDCPSLTNVSISESVTVIGDWAFYACSSLTSVSIPELVTEIGERAFYRCSSLTSVNIPSSVIEIKKKAFSNCYSLTSIIIPPSVKKIGDQAFEKCHSLKSIIIAPSVTKIGFYAFYDCTSLTSIIIPPSVTEIGLYAFSGCSSLTSIKVSKNTEIGYNAFMGCPNVRIERY